MLPFSLVDTIPPHIYKCPVDKTLTIETGEEGAPYSWTEPYARDDGTGNATLLRRSHAPGITFPPGVTYVTYVFADNGGNEATCRFEVNVKTGLYGTSRFVTLRPISHFQISYQIDIQIYNIL